MTKQKDLKEIIRARMEKTGESYQTARRHVVGDGKPWGPQAAASLSASTAIDDVNQAYDHVNAQLGDLDLRLSRETGSGLYDAEELHAFLDELVLSGEITARAAEALKPEADSMIANYDYDVTTGGIHDLESMKD